MKIYPVTRANKEHWCRRCGKIIKKGDPYKYTESRFRPKITHCNTCGFRSSELTTSETLIQVYETQEGLEDVLATLKNVTPDNAEEAKDLLQGIYDALEGAASSIQDVSDELGDKISNMEEYFQGAPQLDEMQERQDALEEWRTELEDAMSDVSSAQYEMEDEESEEDDDEEEDKLLELSPTSKDSFDEAIDKVEEATSSLSL